MLQSRFTKMSLLAVMKHLLIAAATQAEIQALINHLQHNWSSDDAYIFELDNRKITICITGVGLMASSFALARLFATAQYDFAMQVGIAGSFDQNIPLGSIVSVSTERLGDLGAEDHDTYMDIFELGFVDPNIFPYNNGALHNNTSIALNIKLPEVKSLSVNMVSGNSTTIDRRKKLFDCAIESMEGAAFHYACLQNQIPFLQIRSISNYVIPRDKSTWKIKVAIDNLNNWLINNVVNFAVFNQIQ